ncbi:MAG: PipX family protein [Jaaginema sp. PMC 1079.18]|nr:PipX family protein [Jaaginema sp. PMC 1080.18]MEC4852078.1 PipX family protein [Jaaginema sp. PMC 1079.18]MEC4867258.1 PipX family protein [Jaaginema sp. PMC 1078.18]
MNSNETYLNHPTFGLLYKICKVEENQELFTTLYAQRLFFVVTAKDEGITFEPVSRSEGRLLVENWMRHLRRSGNQTEYLALLNVHQRTFQGA